MRQMFYRHRHNAYKSNVLLFCSCLPVRLPTVKNQLSHNINIFWFWNMEVKTGQVMVVYTTLKHVAFIESYFLKRNSISQIIKKRCILYQCWVYRCGKRIVVFNFILRINNETPNLSAYPPLSCQTIHITDIVLFAKIVS